MTGMGRKRKRDGECKEREEEFCSKKGEKEKEVGMREEAVGILLFSPGLDVRGMEIEGKGVGKE